MNITKRGMFETNWNRNPKAYMYQGEQIYKTPRYEIEPVQFDGSQKNQDPILNSFDFKP
jgi:hypothetical protein